jgi:hydroxypyruvate isomerase
MGDRTAFGVRVMAGVGSPRIKLLYDIYHMQIMEGDVIRTIRDNIAQLAHFHTGGVPGRHDWTTRRSSTGARCARRSRIPGSRVTGHEFVPSRDPLTSLGEAVRLCDV